MNVDRRDYWEQHWNNRLEIGICGWNIEKIFKLLYELSKRSAYYGMSKLEIGCGACLHVDVLRQIWPGWSDKYLGIDLSEKAIEVARRHGINAVVGDFMDSSPIESGLAHTFDLVLLLDVFEHIGTDYKGFASKILEYTKPHFTLFGNSPLYIGKEARLLGMEHPVSALIIDDFCKLLGLRQFAWEIYGIGGWPYILFEACS